MAERSHTVTTLDALSVDPACSARNSEDAEALDRDRAATAEAAMRLSAGADATALEARLRRAVGALRELRRMILSDLNEQMTPLNQAHAATFKQPYEAARTIRWADRVRRRLINDAPALIDQTLRDMGAPRWGGDSPC